MTNPLMGYISQMLPGFKANPMQFLMRRRFNIPQNVPMNDPNAIIDHLLKSGQVSQDQINAIYQQMGQVGR